MPLAERVQPVQPFSKPGLVMVMDAAFAQMAGSRLRLAPKLRVVISCLTVVFIGFSFVGRLLFYFGVISFKTNKYRYYKNICISITNF